MNTKSQSIDSKYKPMTFTIDKDLAEDLRKYAFEDRTTKSEWIRDAISLKISDRK